MTRKAIRSTVKTPLFLNDVQKFFIALPAIYIRSYSRITFPKTSKPHILPSFFTSISLRFTQLQPFVCVVMTFLSQVDSGSSPVVSNEQADSRNIVPLKHQHETFRLEMFHRKNKQIKRDVTGPLSSRPPTNGYVSRTGTRRFPHAKTYRPVKWTRLRQIYFNCPINHTKPDSEHVLQQSVR